MIRSEFPGRQKLGVLDGIAIIAIIFIATV